MKLATTKDGTLRRYFAAHKVAEALDVHERTIIRMIQRKEITGVRLRANILLIPEEELERIMQRQREGREFKPETVSQFIPEQDSKSRCKK